MVTRRGMGEQEPERERRTLNRPVRLRGKPVLEGICFQIVEVPGKTETGLVIPEGAEQSFQSPLGLILAVGPDVKSAKPGDKFLIVNRPAGCIQHPIHTEDIELYMGTESQIAVILDAPVCPDCGAKIYETGVSFDHSECSKKAESKK